MHAIMVEDVSITALAAFYIVGDRLSDGCRFRALHEMKPDHQGRHFNLVLATQLSHNVKLSVCMNVQHECCTVLQMQR